MRKLIILDYTTDQAHSYTYDSSKYPTKIDIENLINTLGHDIDNCDWMSTNEEIIIH